MGGPSERQIKDRLNSIKEKTGRREKDVQKDFTRIEKMKVDALKKAEEMRQTAYKDINKIEKNVIQSKDLAPESKDRLRVEIAQIRDEIEDKHARLRTKISETMIPAVTEQVHY
jgi:DNA repair exonuclease SbcCD ATPase subunit